MNVVKPHHCFKSKKGSMLIQVMIVAAMSFVVILAITQMTVLMAKMSASSQLKLSLFEIRNELLSVLLTDTAWTNTVSHADNTADPASPCLAGTNGDVGAPLDCSGRGGNLTLVDASTPPKVVIAKAAVTNGYSAHGQACNSFSAAAPDPLCPIRVSIQWATDCSPPCTMRAPPIQVNVVFEYTKTDNTVEINTNNLNFSLRR